MALSPNQVAATTATLPLVFADTRVPLDTLFEYLESGETLDEFLRRFPTVTREQAVGVLEQSRRLSREHAVPA